MHPVKMQLQLAAFLKIFIEGPTCILSWLNLSIG